MNKERGLIMTHEMNVATREDKKNTTRRLSGLHNINVWPDGWKFNGFLQEPNRLDLAVGIFYSENDTVHVACPYGRVGTVLWIKEAHWHERKFPNAHPDSPRYDLMRPIYKADKQPHVAALMKWRPGYTMPRKYARTFVQITELHAERLQDITNVGAIDEGMLTLSDEWITKHFPEYRIAQIKWVRGQGDGPPIGPAPRERFRKIIDSLHKDGIWEQNLWCWVIKFKRLTDYK